MYNCTALASFLSFFSKTYQLITPLLNIGINNRHVGKFFRLPFSRGDFFIYFGTYDSPKMDEHELSLIRPPPMITGKFDALINGRDFIPATFIIYKIYKEKIQ